MITSSLDLPFNFRFYSSFCPLSLILVKDCTFSFMECLVQANLCDLLSKYCSSPHAPPKLIAVNGIISLKPFCYAQCEFVTKKPTHNSQVNKREKEQNEVNWESSVGRNLKYLYPSSFQSLWPDLQSSHISLSEHFCAVPLCLVTNGQVFQTGEPWAESWCYDEKQTSRPPLQTLTWQHGCEITDQLRRLWQVERSIIAHFRITLLRKRMHKLDSADPTINYPSQLNG